MNKKKEIFIAYLEKKYFTYREKESTYFLFNGKLQCYVTKSGRVYVNTHFIRSFIPYFQTGVYTIQKWILSWMEEKLKTHLKLYIVYSFNHFLQIKIKNNEKRLSFKN